MRALIAIFSVLVVSLSPAFAGSPAVPGLADIHKALGKGNNLEYLYSDMNFHLQPDSESCPNRNIGFLEKFPANRKICSRISYENTDYSTFSILIRSNADSKIRDLLVYNHGHGGVPKDSEPFAYQLISGYLQSGNDVLLVSMPLTGIDQLTAAIRVKTWDGWAEYDPHTLRGSADFPFEPHSLFEFFDTGRSHYIRYFVDSAVVNTFNLRGHYHHINYVGLSGGASTGLYTCSLLKQVLKNCILVAGVMPLKFRLSPKSYGDNEDFSSRFFQRSDITRLIREVSESGVRLALMYNRHDECCYDESSARRFKDHLRENGLGHIEFSIRDSSEHGYDPQWILSALK